MTTGKHEYIFLRGRGPTTYRAWRFRFWDVGCSDVLFLFQLLSLPCFLGFSFMCSLQYPSDRRLLGGFVSMGPDTVLPQALLCRIHLWFWIAVAVSLVTVEICGQVGNHEQSFGGASG